jgi:Bacterial regulatory helix-turn-helix protein, lysR family
MELRHLRYFTAVVQWKDYREASRRLHVAQAAISRTVADLEDAQIRPERSFVYSSHSPTPGFGAQVYYALNLPNSTKSFCAR